MPLIQINIMEGRPPEKIKALIKMLQILFLKH